MSIINFIKQQILRYRDLLANLSRKNKELYYRESRGHCINLSKRPKVEPEYSEILEKQFTPLRFIGTGFQKVLDLATYDLSKHFALDDTHNTEMIKRLNKVRLADDKFQREYGISGAWLLGPFLCWRDETDYKVENLLISPIFKIPVDIKKDKKKKWKLELEECSLQINSSLRLALRQKWGIKLPEQFNSDEVSVALEEMTACLSSVGKDLKIDETFLDSLPKIPPRYKIIKNEQGEIVERQPIKLEEALSKKEVEFYGKVTNKEFYIIDISIIDHLNASRTVLLRDYDSILDMSKDHPILSELFQGKPIPAERVDYKRLIKELDGYKEKENPFVLDIDSSQHRAIDQTRKSQAVVIQGPPGTGKSQTITNLIAETITKGKKVLFVSEKRAALDVVFSRLQASSLDSQAVLIHSSDLNKQNLYNSFLELADAEHDKAEDQKWDQISEYLDQLKMEINKYYEALEVKHKPSNLTVSDLLVIKSKNSINEINISLAKVFSRLPYKDLQYCCIKLDELQNLVAKISNYKNHPWLYRKRDTILTASLKHSILHLIEQAKKHEKLAKKVKDKINSLGFTQLEYIPSSLDIKEIENTKVDPEWQIFCNIFYSNPEMLPAYKQKIDVILDTLKKGMPYYELVSKDADADVIRQLEAYYSIERSFVDYLFPSYWEMRKYRRKWIAGWDGSNKIFRSYRLVCEAVNAFKRIEQNQYIPGLTNVNPRRIIDLEDELLSVVEFSSKIGRFVKVNGLSNDNRFDKFSIESVNLLLKLLKDASELRIELENESKLLNESFSTLGDFFEKPPEFNSENNHDLLDQIADLIDDLEILDKIDLNIESIQKTMNDFSKETVINEFISISASWGKHLKQNVINWWADDLITEYAALRQFDSDTFQKKIAQFIDAEKEHRLTAQNYVNNVFSKRWGGGKDDFFGLSLLKRESNKQRKVLPPREIMEKGALETMLKLKPCWLMSPLSISQILPIEMGIFDVIIFDEASQVRVEDSIPSIFRANSMVVVGDPKQMPPTNFFSANEFIDDDEDDEIELSQSILDLALQIYPAELLEWHYRSRSESLIAFSNRAFYGGRLIAVPNPYFLTEGDVLKFKRVDNAYFNQKQGNLIEAETIVNRLDELLKEVPEKSIGIIAMGQSQMAAIEFAIEQKEASDAEFSKNFEKASNRFEGKTDISLFIKNLENVQGDERDIILISVGYAAAAPGKNVYKNFGPLSKKGGGRRLNVAITRAKEKIEVFCSFDPKEIPTEENDFSKNPDQVVFGRYLKYVKAISEKQYPVAKSILDSFGMGGVITTRSSSRFSKDVHRRLEEIGYKVSSEIGSSGFYIDLGVHHPTIPSNFILGIECDGALFHSTPYARDRDKIRQELLESRGWRIARVWSQDWSKDWRAELDKLDRKLKDLLK